MGDVTHQQGFAHAMARMHMWLSGDDPELLVDYPQCRPIWVWCIAHNLAVAAGHCLSYELGANPPDAEPAKRIRLRTGIAVIPAAVWRPGCGRDAPGWRDE